MGAHLVVFDGFGERLHLHRLVQLIFMKQIDEEVQRALVNAHLRVQRPHALVHLHPALTQSPDTQKDRGENYTRISTKSI